MRRRHTPLLAAATLSALLVACSTDASITVEDPWVRSNPNGMGAAYMVVTSPESDEIVAASVEPSIAGTVEVHEVVMQDGMMRMREVAGIPLPAGEAVTLEPGGYHIMLLDMPAMLEPGTEVELVLTFASGTEVPVTATVRESTMGDGMGMQHGEGMQHGG
jgi:copper(I)-binding protein